ncbi:MAG: iron ABC transporter substrate-binding protein [Methanomicrobium sp.]|nr:iron ABC transporter substrate-binding protein [Methanomicrobium sp.]
MDIIKGSFRITILTIVLICITAFAGCVDNSKETSGDISGNSDVISVTDNFGREIVVPSDVKSVLCSGPGCMRYLVYLQSQDLAAGVDSIEKEWREIEGRPYSLVHREKLYELPLFGEYRGKDDPEKIIDISPDLVFKTGSTGTSYGTSGAEADTLSAKTGIPVVAFPYGSLKNQAEKDEFYSGLRLMGKVLGKDERAEEVISYIEDIMADLKSRTKGIPEDEFKRVYVGGVSSAGAHGIISTEPAYPPFLWVNADNVASGLGSAHVDVAKEAIIDWDPDYIFIDVSTIQMENSGAIGQLKNDPALKGLTAKKTGNVYGVLPYNFYNANYETVFSDAYFIGKILYPERFSDINPEEKADEIYTFFVGEPVLDELNSQFNNTGFSKIDI